MKKIRYRFFFIRINEMRVLVCWYYICADEGLISSGIYQLIQLTDGDWESESLELSRIHEVSIS